MPKFENPDGVEQHLEPAPKLKKRDAVTTVKNPMAVGPDGQFVDPGAALDAVLNVDVMRIVTD